MGARQTGSLYKKTPDAAKWTGAYVDPFDKKRRTITLFTDRRSSQVRLQELITQAERRATGIEDRFAEQRQRPIGEHVDDYLAHCEHVGESLIHRSNKKTQLKRLIDGTGAKRLTDLEPNKVEEHLRSLVKGGRVQIEGARVNTDKGLSSRSVNQHRATAVAFASWCVQTNRLPSNPLKIVPKLDERKDRRYVRRAFTGEELDRLLAAAPKRRGVYLVAVLTGLRRKELNGITWADVDLEHSLIRVRVGVGKAAREDFVPLHAQAAEVLASLKPSDASALELVFPTIPRDKTFRADLKKANVDLADGEGRVVDFHALRTTTGTMLARSGVMPQLAMRILRHSDVKITMKHYTDLRLADAARAVAALPSFGVPKAPANQAQLATGTNGRPNTTERDAIGQEGRDHHWPRQDHPERPTETLAKTLPKALPKAQEASGPGAEPVVLKFPSISRPSKRLKTGRTPRPASAPVDVNVEAPEEARGGLSGAIPFGSVHKPAQNAGPVPGSPNTGHRAQDPYTSSLSIGLRAGAQGKGSGHPKSLKTGLLGAAGAVG